MTHNGITHTIHLHNILYIPSNHNNLFSLGRWLTNGGDFSGYDLTLISKAGKSITKGTLTANNLIKLRSRYATDSKNNDAIHATSSSTTLQLKGWDTWHCCFGHIGYSELHKIFDRELVTGFLVDCTSSMSDCVACTEAKQSVILFNKKGEHDTKPGDLTHIDVWGKYNVALINKFQYYLLFVDDTLQYVIVEFLKPKDQAAQKVKNYFTHLETQGKTPKAMCIDRGHKFVNDSLLEWLYLKGMEVYMTAPYSPS